MPWQQYMQPEAFTRQILPGTQALKLRNAVDLIPDSVCCQGLEPASHAASSKLDTSYSGMVGHPHQQHMPIVQASQWGPSKSKKYGGRLCTGRRC